MSIEPILRPEEVASVLSRGEGAAADAVPEAPGGVPYSLRRPVSFAQEDEPAARARLEQLAAALRQALVEKLETELGLELRGFQQEQAGLALATLPEPAWILAFHDAEQGGLVLALEPTCALSLVELALGGVGNTSSVAREPTALETRVLDNLCTSLLASLGARTTRSFRRGAFCTKRLAAELATPGETVGVGLLDLTIAGTARKGLLLATHGLLEAARREEPVAGRSPAGPLVSKIGRVPAVVRPLLRAGPVALSDLISLSPGTVLRFEATADSELLLMVNGRHVFRGRIVRDGSGPTFRATWRRQKRKTARKGEKP